MKFMKRAGFVLIMLGGPASAQEPAAWVDRCNVEADLQKEQGLRRDSIKSETCYETILNYCTFAVKSDACFEGLTLEFQARSERIFEELPETIDAPEAQRTLYDMRLKSVESVAAAFPCTVDPVDHACSAFGALTSYQLIRALPDWISKFEEDK